MSSVANCCWNNIICCCWGVICWDIRLSMAFCNIIELNIIDGWGDCGWWVASTPPICDWCRACWYIEAMDVDELGAWAWTYSVGWPTVAASSEAARGGMNTSLPVPLLTTGDLDEAPADEPVELFIISRLIPNINRACRHTKKKKCGQLFGRPGGKVDVFSRD